MEAVNETSKRVAKAIELLKKYIEVYDCDGFEEEKLSSAIIDEAIVMLEDALDKLVDEM